ncbi:MAG: hypothetical protein IKT00_04220 [Prevotella sp.]|nr:hypothetical protein [Prevotella sp.]
MGDLRKIISKNRFLQGFVAVVLVLALVRCIFPSVAGPRTVGEDVAIYEDSVKIATADTIKPTTQAAVNDTVSSLTPTATSLPVYTDKKHPIMGVYNYKEAFPDSNDVQLTAALAYGISPLANRDELDRRKGEMVYVGANPYFRLDNLKRSIPYLVPRAAVLLQDIGRSFLDSLYVKHVPLHQMIVTSATRTADDVEKLRGHNKNATENSCHLYGTTFDICYNRYVTVQPPQAPVRRAVQNDTLKWVLSEVLRDLRQQQRCYVKYEVKQGCFHITVR